MQESQVSVSSSSDPVATTLFAPGRRPSPTTQPLTKIVLVQFRNGEAVDRHPELESLLDDGWSIRSAVPRIVEAEGTKLLVVLGKPGRGTRTSAARRRDRISTPQLVDS